MIFGKIYFKWPIVNSTCFCESQNTLARQSSYFSFRMYIRCFLSRHKQLKDWKIAHGKLQRFAPQRANLVTPNNPNFLWASLLTKVIAS